MDNQENQEVVRQRDDALFEALGKSKKRKRRRIILTVVSIVLVLAIAITAAVLVLQKKVREEFGSNSGEVQQHVVQKGSISTTVSGSGRLTDVDQEAITVPEGVEILEVQVKTNDKITEGQVLATVDMATVKSAMADIQAQIQTLDKQISEAEEDKVDSTIKAGVTGRVKAIYAEKGDSVTDIMYKDGALVMLSMDGYMAVDVRTQELAAGDSVKVKRSGGTISGTVESVSFGVATILVTDNGPKNEEEVTVIKDGTELGTGNLYIHNPLRITGYAGTVEKIHVSENEKITASTKVATLTDTSYSANYDGLLRDRTELEETLLELLTIQKDGAVLAPFGGSILSVDHSDSAATSVVTLSPDIYMSVTVSIDEEDILALELGQQVTVKVRSVSSDSFAGTLDEINKTTTDGSYTAVVSLDKVEGMLSGMSATVSIRVEGVDDALLIPVEALHTTSKGSFVYTGYDPETQEYSGKVDVVTGLQSSSYVEIKSGLREGDTVYYTEAVSNSFPGFGNMGGGMGGMGSGNMPSFGGNSESGNSGRPNFGGAGGNMPNFGDMPSGGGQRPSGGNMPNFGGRG